MLRDSKDKDAADDFSYVSDAYPIPWEAPDLYTQVARFLEQPAPKRAPKETVYVFTPGMWDIWSLSALPDNKAESFLTSLVYDMFVIIEKLYDAAHDPNSIAYSNYTLSPLDDQALGLANKTGSVTVVSRADGHSELAWDDAKAQPFRVVVPFLFDPSLVPGWHLARPHAPALHTKPEQLRSVVRLTKRWNDYIDEEMTKWVQKTTSFIHPDDREKQAAEAAAAAEANNEQTGNNGEPSNTSAKHRRDDSNGSTSGGSNGNTNSNSNSNSNNREPSPTLLRDGIVFRMPDYVVDMMIDGQLRAHELTDRKGFGKLPKVDTFLEVNKPCVVPESAGLPLSGDSQPTAEFRFEDDDIKKAEEEAEAQRAKTMTSGNANPTSTRVEPAPPTATESAENKPESWSKHKRQQEPQNNGPASAAVPSSTPNNNKQLQVCEDPDNHLFYTSFSLGQRAIEELGRIAAAIVRADRSTRDAWEINRKSGFERDRQPASWKEYFY